MQKSYCSHTCAEKVKVYYSLELIDCGHTGSFLSLSRNANVTSQCVTFWALINPQSFLFLPYFHFHNWNVDYWVLSLPFFFCLLHTFPLIHCAYLNPQELNYKKEEKIQCLGQRRHATIFVKWINPESLFLVLLYNTKNKLKWLSKE